MHATTMVETESVERCSLSLANDAQRREIYRIRHDVYSRELQQHPANEREELTDALDAHNLYIVARRAGQVVGFVSVTPPPGPYSLDKYLPREQWPVAAGPGTFEVRLLTVTATARGTPLAMALMYAALRYVQWRGGRHVIGIGREQVIDMYRRAGMKPTGQVVCSGAVRYHVMAAEVGALTAVIAANAALVRRAVTRLRWELPFPADDIQPVARCFHGGASMKEAGPRLDRLDDAQRVVNADVLDAWFDPSPHVIAALSRDLAWLVRTSPPADCAPLVDAISEARGLPVEAIVVGAGSSDLIFRCLREWLTPSSRVLLLHPTYGEYAHVLERVIECVPERFELRLQDDYAMSLSELAQRVRKPYDLVILVNPNSPTGTFAPPGALGPVLSEAAGRGTRIWVDETYVDYVGTDQSLEPLAARTPGCFVCKSMSKVYALSGLRVAYLCGHPGSVAALRAITPPWVVGMAAQVAAVRALGDAEFYHQRIVETSVYRGELARELRGLGLRLIEGPANFVLAELPVDAAEVIDRCAARGIYLRDAGSMGIQGGRMIRVAVKGRAENQRVVASIREAVVDLGHLR